MLSKCENVTNSISLNYMRLNPRVVEQEFSMFVGILLLTIIIIIITRHRTSLSISYLI